MTTRTIPKPADRAAWLAARHPYWSASEAAALYDRHPFRSLTAVVAAKLEPPEVAGVENVHMTRGRHLEHAVAAWWEEEHGIALHEPTELYVSPDGAMCATLDRRPVGNATVAVEIKTTAKTIAEPERYWLDQCVAQMWCADLDAVELVAMDATLQLQTWRIERDDDRVADMAERAAKLIEPIRRGQWPADVPTSTPERDSGTATELDDDTAAVVAELADVRERLRALRDDEDHLRRLIVQRLGDHSVGMHAGRNVVRHVATTRHRLDERRLRSDHPELIADYQTSSTYRTLRIVTST